MPNYTNGDRTKQIKEKRSRLHFSQTSMRALQDWRKFAEPQTHTEHPCAKQRLKSRTSKDRLTEAEADVSCTKRRSDFLKTTYILSVRRRPSFGGVNVEPGSVVLTLKKRRPTASQTIVRLKEETTGRKWECVSSLRMPHWLAPSAPETPLDKKRECPRGKSNSCKQTPPGNYLPNERILSAYYSGCFWGRACVTREKLYETRKACTAVWCTST